MSNEVILADKFGSAYDYLGKAPLLPVIGMVPSIGAIGVSSVQFVTGLLEFVPGLFGTVLPKKYRSKKLINDSLHNMGIGGVMLVASSANTATASCILPPLLGIAMIGTTRC
jgi:hypothetical protein